MANYSFPYEKMALNALRGVLREALAYTSEHGLPGAHHFYITFRTDFPGVEVPPAILAQYPEAMTIVLEHQFWGLEVDEHGFAVTLSFRGKPQRLVVPFAAVSNFVDPSVKWGLEFPVDGVASENEPEAETPPPPPAPAPEAEAAKAGEVVKLDLFRKK